MTFFAAAPGARGPRRGGGGSHFPRRGGDNTSRAAADLGRNFFSRFLFAQGRRSRQRPAEPCGHLAVGLARRFRRHRHTTTKAQNTKTRRGGLAANGRIHHGGAEVTERGTKRGEISHRPTGPAPPKCPCGPDEVLLQARGSFFHPSRFGVFSRRPGGAGRDCDASLRRRLGRMVRLGRAASARRRPPPKRLSPTRLTSPARTSTSAAGRANSITPPRNSSPGPRSRSTARIPAAGWPFARCPRVLAGSPPASSGRPTTAWPSGTQGAVARVGSQFSDIREVVQVRLDRGEVVAVKGTKPIGSGDNVTTWCKIAPLRANSAGSMPNTWRAQPPTAVHRPVNTPRAAQHRCRRRAASVVRRRLATPFRLGAANVVRRIPRCPGRHRHRVGDHAGRGADRLVLRRLAAAVRGTPRASRDGLRARPARATLGRMPRPTTSSGGSWTPTRRRRLRSPRPARAAPARTGPEVRGVARPDDRYDGTGRLAGVTPSKSAPRATPFWTSGAGFRTTSARHRA